MKNYRLTSSKVALIAATSTLFALSAPAQATDLFTPENAYQQHPSVIHWSGLYLGGAIGYGNANHDLSARDYFKDYCSNNTANPNFDPFSDPNKSLTPENVNDPVQIINSCEEFVGGAPTGFSTVAADSREIARLDGLNSTGVVGDIRLGYDQQSGRFVFGVFGTYGFSGMEADGSINGAGDFTLERGDDWSAGARVGALVNNRTLLYALAAYTETDYELRGTAGGDAFSQDTTFSGITAGAGVEFALNQNIFLGIEGTHTFYDEEEIFNAYDPETNVGTAITDDLGETKVMGTLKIKLNSDVFGN